MRGGTERMLVRFYGERSMMWVREEDLQEGSLDDGHVAEMQNWERLHRKYTPLLSTHCMKSNALTPASMLLLQPLPAPIHLQLSVHI